jgi:hypothetical protein
MRRISRLFLKVVTLAVPVFIAACYGIAYSFSQRGKVLDRDTKKGIADLRVECRSTSDAITDMTHTAWDGTFQLYAQSETACTTIAVLDDRNTSKPYASTTVKSNSATDLTIEVAPKP